jgi:serine protease
VGTYNGTITLVSSANTVQIPVIMLVSAGAVAADAGFHYVLLLDSNTGETVYQTELSASNGVYQFNIPNVAGGSYLVLAGSDYNNDQFICDAGEACGAYPDLDSLSSLTVSGSTTGVNFFTGLNSVVQAQSADSSGNAPSRGYARFSGPRACRNRSRDSGPSGGSSARAR